MALWTLLSILATCWSAVLVSVWLLCLAAKLGDEDAARVVATADASPRAEQLPLLVERV